MIRLLSALGRVTVIIAALLTVAASAIGGYGWALGYYGYPGLTPMPGREVQAVWGAVLGGIGGIIVAGAVFGPVATLYDIRDNIRRMAR